jgi:serine/threonine-protein kinase
MIGRTLSHYKVLEKIGEGGMGEVYLAKDTKLDREVAVKVLPATFSENKERLARFEREARLLASLNHPNIAAIHELEESDGVHFLALEYVPGETLAERIKRGPIPIDEALPLFKQIAEGLEAAHEKGVIHRDLKPANIKVTPEGKVKVLDFGLAKAMAGETPTQQLSESPTITRDATETGVLLGTAPYMSPEQARGKPLDKRTDIWAFGCCLYEALTGKTAYLGDTVTDTIAKIVEREPDWEELPATAPALLRSLLRRCLHKDLNHRLRDVADARIEIEEAAAEPVTVGKMGIVKTTRPRYLLPVLLVVALLAAFFSGILVWSVTRSEPGSVMRFVVPLPETDRLVGPGRSVAVSPNGKKLVYAAERYGMANLYMRPTGAFEPKLLSGTEGARAPFFSPDGEWIGFWAGGNLKKMPIAGGAPISVCESAEYCGASWAPDGSIFFAPCGSGIYRVATSGDTPEPVTVRDPIKREAQHAFPQALPNGDAVLFHIWYGGTFNVAVKSFETGEQHILVEGGNFPRFLPTGHLLYYRWESRSMEAITFDPERLTVTGPAAPVLEGLWYWLGPHYNVSHDGLLAYVPGAFRNVAPSNVVLVDRTGAEKPLTDEVRLCGSLQVSPDGRRVAVNVLSDEVGVTSDIWVLELTRGTWTRLTFEGFNTDPIWSPDGRRLYFASREEGAAYLVSMPADGSGESQRLLSSAPGFRHYPNSVSPDGKSLLLAQRPEDGSWDIAVLRLEENNELETLLATPFDEGRGVISPDGRWLAYVSNESGRYEVYVRPFPNLSTKWVVSTEGGASPKWSSDGSELFYRNRDQMMAVSIVAEPSFTPGKPRSLFESTYVVSVERGWTYDLADDGQHFVMLRPQESSAPRQIHIVLNWFEELKRLVPTN